MSATDVIYDDANFEQVANIKPTALHRNVDLAVFEADKEGTLSTVAIFVLFHTTERLVQDIAGATSSCRVQFMALPATPLSTLASSTPTPFKFLY